MAELNLHDVPDDLIAKLQVLGGPEGLSLEAFVVRELSVIARQPTNAELLAGLPVLGIDIGEVIEDIERGRRER